MNKFLINEFSIKKIVELGNCPVCNYRWIAKDDILTALTNYYPGTKIAELLHIACQYTSPKDSNDRILNVLFIGSVAGTPQTFYQCPHCSTMFRGETGKKMHEIQAHWIRTLASGKEKVGISITSSQ